MIILFNRGHQEPIHWLKEEEEEEKKEARC
jgi:hypothetical protein